LLERIPDGSKIGEDLVELIAHVEAPGRDHASQAEPVSLVHPKGRALVEEGVVQDIGASFCGDCGWLQHHQCYQRVVLEGTALEGMKALLKQTNQSPAISVALSYQLSSQTNASTSLTFPR